MIQIATPVIGGKPIQNHLVMIFPYDKPLSGLQDKLNNYARYIGNKVNAYVRDHGQTPRYEDGIKNAVAYQNIPFPYTRLTLSDASSVLSHICALLCFEYERSSDNADFSKKRQSLEVYEMITKHGFRYSKKSVESVRKAKEKRMLSVKKGSTAYKSFNNKVHVKSLKVLSMGISQTRKLIIFGETPRLAKTDYKLNACANSLTIWRFWSRP